MLPRAKKRATPSGFMMKGFMPLAGSSSNTKSGTSAPTQRSPFHDTSVRLGSNGVPSGLQDARLYSTRRLAGQDQAQFNVLPMPVGSALSRRAIRLPAGPHAPQKIQQPLEVLPSSRSSPNPDSCSPLRRMNLPSPLGSGRSASALPLYSFAISSGLGSCGIA